MLDTCTSYLVECNGGIIAHNIRLVSISDSISDRAAKKYILSGHSTIKSGNELELDVFNITDLKA